MAFPGFLPPFAGFGGDPFAPPFPQADLFANFGLGPIPQPHLGAPFPFGGSMSGAAPVDASASPFSAPPSSDPFALFNAFSAASTAAPTLASASAEPQAPRELAAAPAATAPIDIADADPTVREALDDVVLFIDANHVSAWARSVLYFALVAGVPLKCCPVDLSRGEHKEDAYLQINPDGKVPALRDSLLYLFESGAIIRYLARKTGSDMEGGPDAAKYGKVQCAIEYVRNNVMPPVNTLVNELYHSRRRGEETNEAAVEEAKGKLHTALSFLEKFFYKQTPDFVIGTTLSTADIYLACALKSLDLCSGSDVFDAGNYTVILASLQKQAYTEEFAGAHKKFNEHLETLQGHQHIVAGEGCGAATEDAAAPPAPQNEGTD